MAPSLTNPRLSLVSPNPRYTLSFKTVGHRMLRMMRMRWCADCQSAKNYEEFYAGTCVGGTSTYCKDCTKERNGAYQRANRDKVNAWSRGRRVRRPEHYRVLHTNKSQNRRARKRAQFVEAVDRMKVYERDAGLCGICGEHVPLGDLDIDHIVPLAAGGEHSYSNVRVTHSSCNRRRPRNYTPEEALT